MALIKTLSSALIGIFCSGLVYAHGGEPWSVQSLPWTNSQITRAIVFGSYGHVLSLEGHSCLSAPNLAFDILDKVAFDIDETVWVDITFYDPRAGTEVQLVYDRADGKPSGAASLKISDAKGHLHRETVTLEHARFANLGFDGTDFELYAPYEEGVPQLPLTVCGLSIRRSYETPATGSRGEVVLEILDEDGRPTPARVGIYDRQGRLPLPSEDAIPLQSLSGRSRVVQFPVDRGHAIPLWPIDNRSVFYVNGSYRTNLPAGDYQLVIAKGLEYRMVQRPLKVAANQSNDVKIQMERWRDMAKRGWISGDDHIHYALQSDQDRRALQVFTKAEDVRVANILHMGNAVHAYFPIDKWEPTFNPDDNRFVLVPGQEDPRTARLGHTISLNLKAPVRNVSRYPLYHEIFEKVRSQGGLVGYAHVTDGHINDGLHVDRGMAVDVPFGILDFAEVLSGPFSGSATWFDFLNLGYKLSPTAGTDYLYGSLPGAQRTYAKLDGPFTAKAWFDALKAGRTFVTNGPVLDFSINRNEVGSELYLKPGEPMAIKASASLNPDFGSLASLELIEQGEVVKRSGPNGGEAALSYEVRATHSTWFVVRAKGAKRESFAMSAPIYVVVGGHPFWKRSEVPSIVARLKSGMAKMLESEVDESGNEGWESQKALEHVWPANEGLLKSRVAEAMARLDDLVRRAASTGEP